MKQRKESAGAFRTFSEEDLRQLRKALLLSERRETRLQGRRKLERIGKLGHPHLSALAEAGLASSHFWSGEYAAAIARAQQVTRRYGMSAAAVWCSTFLVSIFRLLGMRRQRFEAEGERFRLMRKIAFQSESMADRMYALEELQRELEARDLAADAQKCADELGDLVAGKRERRGEPGTP